MSQATTQAPIQEHDSVFLTEDLEAYDLERDDQGVVVEIFKEGLGYAVEFFDCEGNTTHILVLTASQVRPVPKGFTEEF